MKKADHCGRVASPPRYSQHNIYQQLESSTHIRLLTIDDHICTLVQHDLASAPPYSCLSYRWDARGRQRAILINGNLFFVHQHLYNIVRRLTGNFWIDAICINQDDTTEREAQVRIMDQIFKTAVTVYGYLGELEDGEYAEQYLDELLGNIRITLAKCQINGRSAEDNGLLPSSHPGWIVINAALLSEYFQRRWILQEYILASELYLVIGDRIFGSDVLEDLVAIYNHVSAVNEYFNSRISPLKRLEFMRAVNMTLLERLGAARHFAASIPVDMVYAILGICSDGHQIKVNYAKPARDLFLEIAGDAVADGQGPQVLYQKASQNTLMLPSWVPDWSDPGSLYQENWDWIAENHSLTAGGPAATMNVDGETLRTSATFFDNVAVLADLLCYPPCVRSRETRIDREDVKTQADFLLAAHKTAMRDFYDLQNILLRDLPHNQTVREPTCEDFERVLHMVANGVDIRHLRDTVSANTVGVFTAILMDHRLCHTRDGRIGLVPLDTEVSDILATIPGFGLPVVLRRCGPAWTYVRHCLIHGVMHGEVTQMHDLTVEEITLM